MIFKCRRYVSQLSFAQRSLYTVHDKSNVRVAQDSRKALCTHHAVLTARPREIMMKMRIAREILCALRVHDFMRIVRKIN